MLASQVTEFRRGEILTAERLNQLRAQVGIVPSVAGAYSQGRVGGADQIHIVGHERAYYQLTGDLEVIERTPPGGQPTFDEFPSATCRLLIYDNRINDRVEENTPRDSRVWFPRLPTWAIWPKTGARIVAWAGDGRYYCDMELPEKLFGKPLSDVLSETTGQLRVHYFDTGADDWLPVIDPVTDSEVDIEARNPWSVDISEDVISTIVLLGTGDYIFDGSDCSNDVS